MRASDPGSSRSTRSTCSTTNAGASCRSAFRVPSRSRRATGEGLEALGDAIEARFLATLRPMELLVPYDEGGSLSELHDLAGDLEREDTAEGVRVRARVPAAAAAALRALCAGRRSPARVIVRFRRLSDSARPPTRAHDGDAGHDLHAAEAAALGPGERASVGTGIAVAIPEGHAGLVLPRSGLAARHGISLVNAPGLIDPATAASCGYSC